MGLRISEYFSLSAEASYQNYLGLYQGAGFTLNASLSPAGEAPFIYDTTVPEGYTALPKQKRGLKLIGLKPERIFPVFKNHYDENPLASVVLHNYSNSPATDVQVTAEFKGYMDGPRALKAPTTLTAGQTQILPVNALFNDQILSISEATKLGLTFTVKYTQDGGTQTETYSPSVDVLFRDAITWDDDRHVAAFISARDPAAFGLVRGLVSATRDLRNRALSQNLQTAMVVHEALKQHGMVYSKVPNSPFNTGNQVAVDTVQFPQEALKSRTGDCSDLTVLWCSLLESVGIETAAVTIPGHIYMAFALDLPPEQAVNLLGGRDMFIFKNGKAWVPIETTMITDSFYAAWQEGARESDPASQPDLGFYPIHEAWKAFAPIVVSADAPVPAIPATSHLAEALNTGIDALIRVELEPRAAKLKAEMAAAADPAKATNSLALLYARYGRYDQATSILNDLIAQKAYGPAYVNLGNIKLIEKEYQAALDRYQAWLTINPVEPLAIAGQALAYDGLGQREQARQAFTKLAELDKKLAQKYAYLNSAEADSGGRAAQIGQLDSVLGWKE